MHTFRFWFWCLFTQCHYQTVQVAKATYILSKYAIEALNLDLAVVRTNLQTERQEHICQRFLYAAAGLCCLSNRKW